MDSQVSLLLYTKLVKDDFIDERTYSITKAEYRRSHNVDEDSKPKNIPQIDSDLIQVYSISAIMEDCDNSSTNATDAVDCLSLPRRKLPKRLAKVQARLRHILKRLRRRLASKLTRYSETVEFVGGGVSDINDLTRAVQLPANSNTDATENSIHPSIEVEKALKYNVSRRSIYDSENRLLSRCDDEFSRLSSRRRRYSVRRPLSAAPLLNSLAQPSTSSSHLHAETTSVEPSTTWPLTRRPFSWNPTSNVSTTTSAEDSSYFGFCSFCGRTFDDEIQFDAHVNSRCLSRERMNATNEMSGISWDDIDVREVDEENENEKTTNYCDELVQSRDESIPEINYAFNVSIGRNNTTLDSDVKDVAEIEELASVAVAVDEGIINDSVVEICSNASSTEVVTIRSGSWSGFWSHTNEAEADFVEISLASDEDDNDRSKSITSGYITSSNFSSSAPSNATSESSPSTSPYQNSDHVFVFDSSHVKGVAQVSSSAHL